MKASRPVSLLAITPLAASLATASKTPAAAAAESAGPSFIPAADKPFSFLIDGTTTYGTRHIPAHRREQSLAINEQGRK